ncbi:MAG: DUF4202 family protein [Candidatus Pacebacteria bacterium]|nr:DUF4202 family protein [Candidatus Paceibacterota bacterium]
MKQHQEKGAEIIAEFLSQQNTDEKIIEKVKSLVSRHEVGGNEEQNALKDADYLSFLENNIDYFISNYIDKVGKKKLKKKLLIHFKELHRRKQKKLRNHGMMTQLED